MRRPGLILTSRTTAENMTLMRSTTLTGISPEGPAKSGGDEYRSPGRKGQTGPSSASLAVLLASRQKHPTKKWTRGKLWIELTASLLAATTKNASLAPRHHLLKASHESSNDHEHSARTSENPELLLLNLRLVGRIHQNGHDQLSCQRSAMSEEATSYCLYSTKFNPPVHQNHRLSIGTLTSFRMPACTAARELYRLKLPLLHRHPFRTMLHLNQ